MSHVPDRVKRDLLGAAGWRERFDGLWRAPDSLGDARAYTMRAAWSVLREHERVPAAPSVA